MARLAVDACYHVVLSNSREPGTLSDLTSRLGPHARAATAAEAAAAGDIVVVTVPLKAYPQIPAEPLAGKIVIDLYIADADRDHQFSLISRIVGAPVTGGREVCLPISHSRADQGVRDDLEGAARRAAIMAVGGECAVSQDEIARRLPAWRFGRP